ncbi:uncharacterized protein LOC118200350 isoform X2 [Stegodyphus dumicola]|nr:uncharacterized protein LOC118200350 isoform X2 [Stegodyphus dumicola]
MELEIANMYLRFRNIVEEEYVRNEVRFNNIQRTLHVFSEDFHFMKEAFGKNCRQMPYDKISNGICASSSCRQNLKYGSRENRSTQTRKEPICRKQNHAHAKCLNNENELTRDIIIAVKKSLNEITKETIKQLNEHKEEQRHLDILLSHISQNNEDIKSTIVKAFSIATEETKKTYNQFGNIGQDVMRYIAVLNDNTNRILSFKLEETAEKLAEISDALSKQFFDISAVKSILDFVDDQFDEMFRNVELGYQKNTEHYEEAMQNLGVTTEKLNIIAAQLEEIIRQFNQDAFSIKHMLEDMKNQTGIPNISEKSLDVFPEKTSNGSSFSEVLTLDTNAGNEHCKNPLYLLPSTMNICLNKMEHFNQELQARSSEIQNSVKELILKLNLLLSKKENVSDRLVEISDDNFNLDARNDETCGGKVDLIYVLKKDLFASGDRKEVTAKRIPSETENIMFGSQNNNNLDNFQFNTSNIQSLSKGSEQNVE